MDFRLLGPLEVMDDRDRELSIGAGRQRALLALLIIRANELVPTDSLVEELWGESPPPTAQRMLHNQVSALRRTIGTPVTVEPGIYASAVFSPDGSQLFAVTTRGQGLRLNVSPEAWKRHACVVAGRDLTADEWEDALPARPYQAVCTDN